MEIKNIFSIFLILLLTSLTSVAEVPEFLKRLEQDPVSASREIPEKRGARREALFDEASIARRNFVTVKDQFRSKILCTESRPGEPCSNKVEFFALEAFNDEWRLKQFLGTNYETNILRLDALNEGRVPVAPWTGYYWPIFEGGIGNRYGDPQFPRSQNFKYNYSFYERNYLRTPQTDPITLGRLSPSEKYDYIINDHNWNLTQSVWADGKSYFDKYGTVETWMGICHGWAPASFMVPEPRKAIPLTLEGNRGELTLYPHDLKALISQLWAEVPVNYNFLGGRCNEKNPRTDATGRIISSECFDINPSLWHLVLTHWLGRNHQSFVMDATYDYEVWNQPIYSYKLKYFNPKDHNQGSMKESLIRYSDLRNDPYAAYRSSQVKYLIGVASEIQYIVEENPYHSSSSSSSLNRLVTVVYYYDLELDEDYNIIGGEWYQKAHPDMIWKPSRGAKPQVRGEDKVSDWAGVFPMPRDLSQFATKLSAYKTPLSKILDELIERAAK